MAYEDLASKYWLNTPPPQYGGGLLAQPTQTPYERIMSQMQTQPTVGYQGLLSGGYKPGIYRQRTPEDLLQGLSSITDIRRGGGVRNEAEQARINAFFDAMTPAELAAFQKKNADFLNMLLTPAIVKIFQRSAEQTPAPVENRDTIAEPNVTPTVTVGELTPATGGYNPAIFSPVYTPTVTVGELSPLSSEGLLSQASAPTVSTGGGGYGGGGIGSMGIGGGGGTGTGAVSSAVSGGTLGGTMGISTSSLGGVGSGGGDGGGGVGSGGGGGGGGGGGCCFIMLEARYGDGTMDRVVRKYRDENITERNKRGYYKVAEVVVPLMREYWLFKILIVLLFADPAVAYAKYYYGENKWGWIFTPLKKFWMRVFDVVGTDTKFIRENGETV